PFFLDRNKPPAATFRSLAPDYKQGKLLVGFALSDAESNPVSLTFEYSADNGATWKAGTPDRSLANVPSSGYSGSFGWSYAGGLVKGKDYSSVRVRLTPSDFKDGATAESAPVRVDLNEPPAAVLNDIFTTQSGDVRLSYHITDAEGDTLRFACSYSTDNGSTWKPTVNVSGAEGITAPQGMFIWHSGRDLPSLQSYAVRFRIVPSDHDTGTGDDTGSFQLFNNGPPQIAVTFPDTAGYRIRLPYTLTDPEKDPARIRVVWSRDEGVSWRPAAIFGDTLNLPTAAHKDTLLWAAHTDLGEGFFGRVLLRALAGDAKTPPDSTGAGKAEGALAVDNLPPHILALRGTADRDTVYIRFDEPLDEQTALDAGKYALSGGLSPGLVQKGREPGLYHLILASGSKLPYTEVSLTATGLRDRFGNTSGPLAASFFPDDGNLNPAVALDDLPAEVSGDVTVQYTISDQEKDAVTLSVAYSADDGATWRPATVDGALSGPGPDKYIGSFVWRTTADLTGKDISGVRLKVTPRDTQDGEPAVSTVFRVDNNAPPAAK
ncbi:MAG: sialidase family protein, partial [Candidatus Latescibacterota bacterium]